MRRRDPDGLSVGDEAEVVVGPGLLQWLMLRDGSGLRLDEGLCAEWMVPMSVGAAAMYAVLRPPAHPAAPWSSARVAFEWARPARRGEMCVGRARIDSLGRTSARVAYSVAGDADAACGAGESVMIHLPSGTPAPIDGLCAPRSAAARPIHDTRPAPDGHTAHDVRHAAPPGIDDVLRWHPRLTPAHLSDATADDTGTRSDDVLLRLRRPRRVATFMEREGRATAGDTWVWWFAPDLLRLLAHPLGGAREPLGREFHPAARTLNGSMVYAGLRAAGAGYEPATLTAQYRKAPGDEAAFTLFSRVTSADADGVALDHVLFQDGAVVSDGSLVLRRTQRPRVE